MNWCGCQPRTHRPLFLNPWSLYKFMCIIKCFILIRSKCLFWLKERKCSLSGEFFLWYLLRTKYWETHSHWKKKRKFSILCFFGICKEVLLTFIHLFFFPLKYTYILINPFTWLYMFVHVLPTYMCACTHTYKGIGRKEFQRCLKSMRLW